MLCTTVSASEFSESYHIKASNQQEGIALLQRAGLKGYVFPEKNGWVTILPQYEKYPFIPIEKLIKANESLMVYYACAEDHGWTLNIYQKSENILSYDCDWTYKEIRIKDNGLNLAILKKIIGKPSQEKDDHFWKKVFYPKNHNDIFENELPSYNIAKLLSLPFYEWLSYDYIKKTNLEVYYKQNINIYYAK